MWDSSSLVIVSLSLQPPKAPTMFARSIIFTPVNQLHEHFIVESTQDDSSHVFPYSTAFISSGPAPHTTECFKRRFAG